MGYTPYISDYILSQCRGVGNGLESHTSEQGYRWISFIGRERELKFLQDRYTSDRSELIIVYGRRRIGKTELLKQFSKGSRPLIHSRIQKGERIDKFAASSISMIGRFKIFSEKVKFDIDNHFHFGYNTFRLSLKLS